MKLTSMIEEGSVSKCGKCKSNLLSMSGGVRLNPDQEPYINGKKEDPKSKINELDITVDILYCEGCHVISSIWGDID